MYTLATYDPYASAMGAVKCDMHMLMLTLYMSGSKTLIDLDWAH